jgi:hypothetical protein
LNGQDIDELFGKVFEDIVTIVWGRNDKNHDNFSQESRGFNRDSNRASPVFGCRSVQHHQPVRQTVRIAVMKKIKESRSSRRLGNGDHEE